jgi:hypothetical protein
MVLISLSADPPDPFSLECRWQKSAIIILTLWQTHGQGLIKGGRVGIMVLCDRVLPDLMDSSSKVKIT